MKKPPANSSWRHVLPGPSESGTSSINDKENGREPPGESIGRQAPETTAVAVRSAAGVRKEYYSDREDAIIMWNQLSEL